MEEISDTEAFESSLERFLFCLKALASTPEAACEAYGHYNVARELQLDVLAGDELSKNPAHRFNEGHLASINGLCLMLSDLPEEAVRPTESAEESLSLMHHPAWEVVRERARALLRALAAIDDENQRYFKGPQH